MTTTNPPGPDHRADTPTNVGYVAKLIAYLVLAVLTPLQVYLRDGISAHEGVLLAIAFLGALAVYWAPPSPIIKGAITFALAGAEALALVVTESAGLADVDVSSWIGVVIAALASIGVALIPNAPRQQYAILEAEVVELAPAVGHPNGEQIGEASTTTRNGFSA